MYFSGQGKLYIASRNGSGNATAFRYVGNVPDLKLSVSTDIFEHKESVSGDRITDLRLTKEKKCECSFTLEEFTPENLAMGLYGSVETMATHTVTGEVFPSAADTGGTDLVAGDIVRLKYPNVTGLVITDSTGSPKTLPSNQYTLRADYGSVTLDDITSGGAYVQPFKAAYTAAATGSRVRIFSQAAVERWLRFEGLNTADGNAPVLIELYRVLLDPAKELSLISDEINQLALTGGALFDSTKTSDAELGGFGRVVQLT